jgi:hypothetical protein
MGATARYGASRQGGQARETAKKEEDGKARKKKQKGL